MKTVIKGLNLQQLEEFLSSLGEPKYRAKQVFHGMYVDRYTSFDQFSTLSKPLKQKLEEKASLPELTLKKHLTSKDGTMKMTFETEPGKEIETVWIPTGDLERRTICVSSQVGCTLDCRFCATGTLDFKGNLKAWHIIDQVMQVERLAGQRATNIVFMGMGEPMHNYDTVINAASLLHHPDAFNLGAKRITISTSGVIPGIERFIKENQPFNFAISLNHPNPEVRGTIMPINDKYPLERLLEQARNFTKTLKRKVTFEYIMIPNINMGKENARRLIKIARSVNCKINLIPLNTDFNGWKRPTEEQVEEFKELIKPAGVPILNRKSPGRDIHGACGMLSLRG